MSEPEDLNADSLLAEADTLFQAQEYPAALEHYTRALEIARQEFNRPVETEAMAQMARCNLVLGNKEKGRKWLDEAARRGSDSDPMGWSCFLGVKGRFEWKDGDLKAARQTFDEMYVYCNTNALWARAVDAANMIAIVADDVDEQIEWSKRGIETAEAGGAENWLGPLWNNLGATYYDNKQYEPALEAFLKARTYHWQYSGENAKLFADYHVGMAYRAVGQLEKAGQWLRPVLAWAERLGNHSASGQAAEDLGEIALAAGKKSEGLELLRRARDEYKLAGLDQSAPQVWENINKRLKELGE
ncbi:MAG: tetratricopeptide repeat protein [Candidatus Zixiibacteriota bacterium]